MYCRACRLSIMLLVLLVASSVYAETPTDLSGVWTREDGSGELRGQVLRCDNPLLTLITLQDGARCF